jgi:YVTN family beta-propeller protein
MQIGIKYILLLALCLLASCMGTNNPPVEQITPAASMTTQVPTSPPTSTVSSVVTHHYEYVFPDSGMYVYDMDHKHALVKTMRIPTIAGVRGVAASPSTHMLYVSYGGDGGGNGNGSLLKYDLLTNTVDWKRDYSHGIDSMAITPDGKTIYMPDGELSPNGTWYVIDANTGNETDTINGGSGPHNTIVSLNGKHVYLGGRNYRYLEVADTATNRVIKSIGPLLSGVRPFTINGKETIAYMSTTGFLGFQVGDITTGKILYTVPIRGFSWDGSGPSDPSHGISLSPDEKELYVIDWANDYVHVYDVSNVPASAPRQVADIRLTRSMHHNETPCAYDCLGDGWLQHSRDGRFVYIGDEGDVIDTATRSVVANLAALYNTRKMLEIDWQNGMPISTTSREGVGYVTNSASTLPPTTSLTISTFPTNEDLRQGVIPPRYPLERKRFNT